MESIEEIWIATSEYCKANMTEVAFNAWIKAISPVSLTEGELVLFVRTPFQRSIILENYSLLLRDAVFSVLGFHTSIRFVTEEDKSMADENLSEKIMCADYEYTFETFIIGASNRFAHAAALAVAENPAVVYNPLFIYGNSGLGKTHLLNAIHKRISEKVPGKKLLYARSEDFTNEVIHAIHNNKTTELREKYRTADVLLMDDIQFIAGKESTQEEFFNTFNVLYGDKKQIVVTSDRSPKDIKTLDERIRTRFEAGLLADIQNPEFETRVGIIKRKSEILNLNIEENVIYFISDQLKSNIRQLEGVVKKLQAYTILQNAPPTVSAAQTAIKEVRNDDNPEPVTVERIMLEVSRTKGISPEDMRSKKRSANISHARMISMYIVREITGMPFVAIGEEFGGRDHSTVVYALNQIENIMAENPHEKATIEDIIKNIRG
ncbi:MAG: chromosomal replication initiator protein DnaA [Oscillospiraceae bacterium]|jgi:chromosomal replication initiator protein|nr:chromosomal replication initiator protein DnaA [Oscillospiraceae bacterium]